MRYELFDGIDIRKIPDDLKQKEMERLLREVLLPPVGNRWTFSDRMEAQFDSCSYEERSLTLTYATGSWMENSRGNMHGGLIACYLDLAMGVLARFFKGCSTSVTVQMSVQYMRGIALDGDIKIKAIAEKTGKNVCFTSAKVYRASDGELAAMATAEYI